MSTAYYVIVNNIAYALSNFANGFPSEKLLRHSGSVGYIVSYLSISSNFVVVDSTMFYRQTVDGKRSIEGRLFITT